MPKSKQPSDCPAGHTTEWGQHDAPTCDQCQLIATHYNGRTGEVYEWTTQAEHRQACENLQNAMDDAFDNTYFSGGW